MISSSFVKRAIQLRNDNDSSIEFDIFVYELIIFAIDNMTNFNAKQGDLFSTIYVC